LIGGAAGGGFRLSVSGTVWTATAHIVTAVIGSGVLALAWSVAQLGWVAGPLALAGFACVTFYTSTLLANAYRAPHPVTGTRNRTYMDAVRSYLSTRPFFPRDHLIAPCSVD
jgi:amino acid permease